MEQKLKASENTWSTLGANFQYSFLQNKLRLNSGTDYMTNGQANNIYGFKFAEVKISMVDGWFPTTM